MAFLDNIGLNRLVGNIKNLVSTEIAKVNLFKNIKIGSTTLSASSNSDTFELVEGRNITIGVDEPTNKITISSTGGGNSYTHPTTSGNKHIPSGGSSGQILRWAADGEATWGNDNDTTYTLGSFGITATAQELNYTDGVTSNIQTQLNGKSASNHNHNNNYMQSSTSSNTYTSLAVFWTHCDSLMKNSASKMISGRAKLTTFTPIDGWFRYIASSQNPVGNGQWSTTGSIIIDNGHVVLYGRVNGGITNASDLSIDWRILGGTDYSTTFYSSTEPTSPLTNRMVWIQ